MPLKIKAFTKSFHTGAAAGEYQRPPHDPIGSRPSRIFQALLTSVLVYLILRDPGSLYHGRAKFVGEAAYLGIAVLAWVAAFLPRDTLLKWRRHHMALLFALLVVWLLAVLA